MCQPDAARRSSGRRRDESGEIPMTVLLIAVALIAVTGLTAAFVAHSFGGWWGALSALGVYLTITVGVIGAGWLSEALAARRHRVRDERGASTAFIVLFTVALLTVAGLVIDGGYALGAKREAMNDAEQAARAGADALDQGELRDGTVQVDPGKAVTAAQTYLNSIGANGTVNVNGGEVTVTVTTQQDTKILSAVGVNSIPVKATATALSIDQDD